MYNGEGFRGEEPWRREDQDLSDSEISDLENKVQVNGINSPYIFISEALSKALGKLLRRKSLRTEFYNKIIADVEGAVESGGGLPDSSLPIPKENSEKKILPKLKKVGVIFSAAALFTVVLADDANHGSIHDQFGARIHNPQQTLVKTENRLGKQKTDLWNWVRHQV